MWLREKLLTIFFSEKLLNFFFYFEGKIINNPKLFLVLPVIRSILQIEVLETVLLKGYLRYKTIFCSKVALNV